MSIGEIESKLSENLTKFGDLGAKVKFDFGGDGTILIDGTHKPATMTKDDGEADCTLQISSEDFSKMLAGQLDPTFAFMTGKLKVKGSTAIAMKLSSVLN